MHSVQGQTDTNEEIEKLTHGDIFQSPRTFFTKYFFWYQRFSNCCGPSRNYIDAEDAAVGQHCGDWEYGRESTDVVAGFSGKSGEVVVLEEKITCTLCCCCCIS